MVIATVFFVLTTTAVSEKRPPRPDLGTHPVVYPSISLSGSVRRW